MINPTTSAHLDLGDSESLRTIAGTHNENLKLIERRLGIRIGQRGSELHVSGSDESVKAAFRILEGLANLQKNGRPTYIEDVENALKLLGRSGEAGLEVLQLPPILTPRGGRAIAPRGVAQKKFIDLVRSHDLVFAIGPAGTGKTYLAMALAVAALMDRRVKRIVLARPAVEAGEKLGFLPGDLAEKVNPYLRPLYDALNDMMEHERAQALIEQGVIEVAPLAFMRGRTLNDCFAILDEAQNTTIEQMKMFLTRMGQRSQSVITGDVTQIDLSPGQSSGLIHARSILQAVPGVAFAEFSDTDVVRHPLVQEVIRAYDLASLTDASGARRKGGRPADDEPKSPK